MKVLMVVPHFLPHVGGGEKLYYDIASGLKNRGYEVRVITSNSAKLTGHIPYDGIDTYYYKWRMMCGHPIVKKKDIEKHIQWADIVHTTMFTTATCTRLLAKKNKKPCLITIHEVLGNKWFWVEKSKLKALLFDIYERLICMQNFQAYHVDSNATKRDYEKFCGKRNNMICVYPSVESLDLESISKVNADIKQYFGLEENDQCFLYYGRPAPNKGVFVLQKAIKVLKQRGVLTDNVKFCFILADDPKSQREKFLDYIKANNLQNNIIVRNSVERNKLFKLILDADYVIVPSITEGFGFCAVETCELGKPIIYSSAGSLPEVVFGNCLEFENRNHVDLADKIELVIKYGKTVFDSVPHKRFKTDRMVNEIINIYKNVLMKRML